jgi:hypothetical protein
LHWTAILDDAGWWNEKEASPANVGVVIGTYGFVWLLWLLLNRFVCESFVMMDSFMSFAQIAGTLGDMDLHWPGPLFHVSLAFQG